jgi:hypothetical protein
LKAPPSIKLFACILTLLAAWLPAAVQAAQRATLTAAFTPEVPGASTTITFGFTIASTDRTVPPPLTDVALRLPAGMGLARSTLGLDTCTPTALLGAGLPGCPANSRVGAGTALVEIPLGGEPIEEPVGIAAVLGPPEDEHRVLLFYADGVTPISAQLVFPARILEENSGPYGGELDTSIPIVPSFPEGPDASVVRFSSTLGPLHLTYYKRIHGHKIGYTPQGITIPVTCPHGGFPFQANFTFLGGTYTTAHTTIHCPHHTRTRPGTRGS